MLDASLHVLDIIMTPSLQLSVAVQVWPIRNTFVISRGSKQDAVVVVAEVHDGAHCGRGECVPYERYGETVHDVCAALAAMRSALKAGLSRHELQTAMPPGAARNALDCALWDFEAKRSGRSVASLAGLGPLKPLTTTYTISLASPEEMAANASAASAMPILKLKLNGVGDEERILAVREAVPTKRLIIDANEAWSAQAFNKLMEVAATLASNSSNSLFPLEKMDC